MVFALGSIALLNNGQFFLGEERKQLEGFLLKLSKHFWGVVGVAGGNSHGDDVHGLNVFVLEGELHVVEALVSNEVGVVVGVEDLKLDLHLLAEELSLH